MHEKNMELLVDEVNKFDQKDRHSYGEAEVKGLVANDLMRRSGGDLGEAGSGMVGEGDVFPVSARWAYLANRAKHEVGRADRLPDAAAERWVADFGEEAFGRRWEREVEDPAAVRECAAKLWEESRFDKPLNRVIRAAHSKAAKLALVSAMAKVADLSDRVSNFTSTRLNKELEKVLKDLAGEVGTRDGVRRMIPILRENVCRS